MPTMKFIQRIQKFLTDFIQRIQKFLTDWDGKPRDDGHSAVPGVMEQMRVNDERIERMEFHLGNGSAVPLREMVIGNAQQVKDLRDQVSGISDTVDQIETWTARLPADRRYNAAKKVSSEHDGEE